MRRVKEEDFTRYVRTVSREDEEESTTREKYVPFLDLSDDEDDMRRMQPPLKRQHVEEAKENQGNDSTKAREVIDVDQYPFQPATENTSKRQERGREEEVILNRIIFEQDVELNNDYGDLLRKQKSLRKKVEGKNRELEARIKDLEFTLNNAKQERRRYRNAVDRIKELENRMKDMEASAKAKEDQQQKQQTIAASLPDITELDDLVSCEICTMKMWYPATIRECGHTFCETCLHGWFHQTYTQHVAQHPEFLRGPQIPPEYLIHQHIPVYAQAIGRMAAAWRAGVARPVYSCPTCRQQVTTRPLEIFFLKDVVRKVAKMIPGPADQEREHSPGPNRLNQVVWDGFFPA